MPSLRVPSLKTNYASRLHAAHTRRMLTSGTVSWKRTRVPLTSRGRLVSSFGSVMNGWATSENTSSSYAISTVYVSPTASSPAGVMDTTFGAGIATPHLHRPRPLSCTRTVVSALRPQLASVKVTSSSSSSSSAAGTRKDSSVSLQCMALDGTVAASNTAAHCAGSATGFSHW